MLVHFFMTLGMICYFLLIGSFVPNVYSCSVSFTRHLVYWWLFGFMTEFFVGVGIYLGRSWRDRMDRIYSNGSILWHRLDFLPIYKWGLV